MGQNYKFTGYERDPETGLDYAFARYYNSRLGRFTSPDLELGDRTNPQLLNRYAYVGNGPINYRDPGGTVIVGIDYCYYVEEGYQFPIGLGFGLGYLPPEVGTSPFFCDQILLPPPIRSLTRLASGLKPPLATCHGSRRGEKPEANGRCYYKCTCGAGFGLFASYQSVESYLLKGMIGVEGCRAASKDGAVCPPQITSIEINIGDATSYALVRCDTVQ